MFPKIGGFPPKWMVKIMVPNPMNKWMIWIDLGGFPSIFGLTPRCTQNLEYPTHSNIKFTSCSDVRAAHPAVRAARIKNKTYRLLKSTASTVNIKNSSCAGISPCFAVDMLMCYKVSEDHTRKTPMASSVT